MPSLSARRSSWRPIPPPNSASPWDRRPDVAVKIKICGPTTPAQAWDAVWGILVDAPHDTLYGGTGAAWDYERVASGPSIRRLFLAGGLGPDNVRRAVESVRPYAIDVCSRVESRPGRKDLELLRRLFQEVRHGETQTPP